jgi:hypothetical protein
LEEDSNSQRKALERREEAALRYEEFVRVEGEDHDWKEACNSNGIVL